MNKKNNPFIKSQDESLDFFQRILKRNSVDYYGCVILFSVKLERFFKVIFGSGENLDDEDESNGFDDYLMVDNYEWNGKTPLVDIFNEIRKTEGELEEVGGIIEDDGGQMLLKRNQWEDGDIRRYLKDALEFAGYGIERGAIWGYDLIPVYQCD